MTNDEWMQQLEQDFTANFVPMVPTVGIADGIRFDFCRGFRLLIPKALAPRRFRLVLVDLDHELKVFDDVLEAGDYYVSKRRYAIRYGFQLFDAVYDLVLVRFHDVSSCVWFKNFSCILFNGTRGS